jgi:release factor glutamine methyltransferase
MKPNASPKQDLTQNKGTTGSLLKRTQEELKKHSESPYLDSLVLLAHITGLTKSQLLANPDPSLSSTQQNQVEQALTRIKAGTPLPYLIGEWEFFQLKFKITEDVLIPRPETEGLVELALAWLGQHPQRKVCLEIGTGCGCIAIAMAIKKPELKIIATDISNSALQVARVNALAHQVDDQIIFEERDLLSGMDRKVDLLIANLPYIPTDKLKSLPVYNHEPFLALDGGADGLYYIKRVLKNAQKHMQPGGAIFLELDEDSGAAALALAREVWPGMTLKLSQDLSGQDRYLSIQCES